MITTDDMKAIEEAVTDTQIRHGVDGWGLEVFSRDEETVEGELRVWGTYVYENEKTRETRKIVRLLDRRSAE
jgi:hypothetical protein